MRMLLAAALLLLVGCDTPEWRELEPYPNPFGAGDAGYAEQPSRLNPLEVAVQGDRAFVTLQGSPDAPGREVAVVDLKRGTLARRLSVGPSPTGLAVHPDGQTLVVANRFANWLSVVSLGDNTVRRLPVDFYAVEPVFSPDGRMLWLTNRWRDAVVGRWVRADGGRLHFTDAPPVVVPVPSNPRDLAMSDDGAVLAVASLTGNAVTLVDTSLGRASHTIDLGAPANGLAFVGPWLVVATLSASSHHPAFDGPDGDHDGFPGDGTPNVNFQDLQNEIAVIDSRTGAIVHRYTSDTICCRDYRDVHPDDAARLGDLLPPADTWIVEGALPEQVVAADGSVWVSYSASNQLQRFAVDPESGALTAEAAVDSAGHAPHGLAVVGDTLLVANRLSETLGVHDLASGEARSHVVVGDVSGGPFPATDAEIGELLNFVTAPFSVDGDQSCAHCHREGGNIDKAFSMPLTMAAGRGLRMTMAYRGAADTRPWFAESAMDETNFKPVLNEFARIENFCCTDYTLWPDGAPADCTTNPPDRCFSESSPGSDDGFRAVRDAALFAPDRPTESVSREHFYVAAAEALMGRTESFGDGLWFEDPISGDRRPVSLDFGGLTRALGLFLLQEPGLLPNPNPTTAQTERGRAIFEDLGTGCAVCHPAPAFALSAGDPTVVMGPVVTPFRDAEEGTNLDLLAAGFIGTFPQAAQDACEDVCPAELCADDPTVCDDLRNVKFGVPSLRGIWDRAPSMLHDGRAQGLKEVLCTPGHPALEEGETGFNERDGAPDTHGGVSHLSPRDVDDLIAYLLSL